MDKAELKRIIAAHDWLWAQWWPALLALSPQQARQVVGGSFPSLSATTAHMVWAEAAWLERLRGRAPMPAPADPADLEGLYGLWRQIAAERQDWLEHADPDTRVTYAYSGGTATNSVAEIVLHFTSHAHFHRGQLASQMRLLGLQPPSAHLISFFRL